MSTARATDLQGFLDDARAALGRSRESDAQAVIDAVFARLERPAPRAVAHAPA